MGFLNQRVGLFAFALLAFACNRNRSSGPESAPSGTVITIDPTFFACADVEVCERECDAGSADSCRRLAASYGFGRGVTKDETRATAIYDHACDMKDPSACVFAGQMYEYGRGTGKDYERAAKLYERACNLAWTPGCYNLAIMYERGTGVPADRHRAAELYQVACTAGAHAACDKAAAIRP